MTDERLEEMRASTHDDDVLQQLKEVIQTGWPEEKQSLPAMLTPYFSFRDEMSVYDGLVFKGERLLLPKRMRRKMEERIHSSHIGVNGCLRRARECMYWPGMTAELKEFIAQCEKCRKYEVKQQREPLMSHEIAERPWEKTGADLYTIDGKDYLIVVDYFSNFWEIDPLPNTKSSTVIKKLKCQFARQGIPDIVISDNGPQFASEKFTSFANEWGFEHRTGSPGHQQTNGKAEAAVKDAKRLLRKAKDSKRDIYLAVLVLRNTPTEAMGTSPAQRLLGRRCKTQLPTTKELLRPQSVRAEAVKKETRVRQAQQAKYYNKGTRDLSPLEEGDFVRMRPFRLGQKEWEKATVTKRHDERSYEVESANGTYRRNRVDLKQQPSHQNQQINNSRKTRQGLRTKNKSQLGQAKQLIINKRNSNPHLLQFQSQNAPRELEGSQHISRTMLAKNLEPFLIWILDLFAN
ncbi:Uncharacterized protein P5673_030588 [Acropora cervicornis]|uniref:Integrase catalytic domain-containing protein n=1 Tax=Acropora cervicornis TaxID=6130 RepID=A0AAD9PU08_ACRCE|nr:Uncharacterized protein P5673_030588 [Acropora cervicornis]